jgi:nicotinate-nucleotide pyrophosphorylase (carboxylating)
MLMELDPGIIYSYASEFIKEDLGRGDITSQSVVRAGTKGRGRFLAKEDFVLCGLEFAEAVFAVLDGSVQLESRAYDGEMIRSGAEFARIEGPAMVLLSGERTALNLLQHLSGVATSVRAFVDKVAGTKAQIVDTRKTTPGLRMIQKYAVSTGGGRNHRLGLDDGILIKDNHIAIAGGVRRAIEAARAKAPHLMKIEVEIGDRAQLEEALAARADAVLLDNMEPRQVRESMQVIREIAPDTVVEVSGRINLDNVREMAESGVDLISVGGITHSARAVDISMKITPL